MLVCLSASGSFAQDVYTSSSGLKGYRHKRPQKGYDPAKLIVGGGINFGYSGDYANFGISPIVGYLFSDAFSAGIGVGYQFYKAPNEEVTYITNQPSYIRENIVFPSIWAKYQVYKNWFADASAEYNIINVSGQAIAYDQNGNQYAVNSNFNTGVPCLLLGVGYRQPLGGRVSVFVEGLVDVLQQDYSPYKDIFPVVRFTIMTGL